MFQSHSLEGTEMMTFRARIEGLSPLLMHRFSVEAEKAVEEQIKTKKADYGTPEEEAEQAAYRIDGPGSELYLLGEAVYQSVVKAGVNFAVPGARGKTYKDAVKGMVMVVPDCIPLGTDKYEIDSRRVRIQRGTCMRKRPRIDKWGAEFEVVILDEEALPPPTMLAILQRAGQTVGVLDYRPRFGRFQVTSWEQVP